MRKKKEKVDEYNLNTIENDEIDIVLELEEEGKFSVNDWVYYGLKLYQIVDILNDECGGYHLSDGLNLMGLKKEEGYKLIPLTLKSKMISDNLLRIKRDIGSLDYSYCLDSNEVAYYLDVRSFDLNNSPTEEEYDKIMVEITDFANSIISTLLELSEKKFYDIPVFNKSKLNGR